MDGYTYHTMADAAAAAEGNGRLPPPELSAKLLSGDTGGDMIGPDDIARAQATLQKYKAGKAALESRIVDEEMWWQLRHWEALRKNDPKAAAAHRQQPEPTSAWLFNAILNKHADAMDNFPQSVFLPRERSDMPAAKRLSSIVPVIYDCAGFDATYSDQWWEKLKHGTAVYGTFWDPDLENGLGDVAISGLDLLNIFWQPGIQDIQDTRNLFIVALVDTDLLDDRYPHLAGKMTGQVIDLARYAYDDDVDTSDKALVVDWYYKVKTASGRTVVHYCKFVGDQILYASQNDPRYALTGYYQHGLYPVVFDTLFPEKGTPVGFGYIAVWKDTQLYIDSLGGNILENAMMGTKTRFFVERSTNIDRDQLLDWTKPLIDVNGKIDDTRIKQLDIQPLPPIYASVLQAKIDELKETSANRDFSAGSTASGVTAASAIAALQEAGNKISRDMIGASYRAHAKISTLIVNLLRQFYTVPRAFRIDGTGDDFDFIDFDNSDLIDQRTGTGVDGDDLFRRPCFDIKIKAQKKNPFSRAEQNERAKELYSMGFFAPERAQESIGALQMMDFEGIDDVRRYIQQGATMMSMLQGAMAEISDLRALIGAPPPTPPGGAAQPPRAVPAGNGQGAAQARAQRPVSPPEQALQRRTNRPMR